MRSNVYKEKTFKEAWCSDTGAYPVMAVIGFAVVFCTTVGVGITVMHPDARVGKYNRKSIFRGDLQHMVNRADDEATLKYINEMIGEEE